MTYAQCQALFERILKLSTGGGETMISVQSLWGAGIRWARNQITLSADATMQGVDITRVIGGARGAAGTTSFDDVSLRIALASAERLVRFSARNPDVPPLPGKQQYVQPRLWGASTYDVSAQAASSTLAERLPAICGSETFTTVVSSTSMKVPNMTATATTHGLTKGWGLPEVGPKFRCNTGVRPPRDGQRPG